VDYKQLCIKSQNPPTWTQSEPPRGSGWVRRRLHENAALAPTRYREVVLTVSKSADSDF